MCIYLHTHKYTQTYNTAESLLPRTQKTRFHLPHVTRVRVTTSIYEYVHTYIHIYIYTHTHTHKHIILQNHFFHALKRHGFICHMLHVFEVTTSIYIYIHTYIHIYIYTHTHTHKHIILQNHFFRAPKRHGFICHMLHVFEVTTFIYKYIHAYIHIYIYTHTHTHKHIILQNHFFRAPKRHGFIRHMLHVLKVNTLPEPVSFFLVYSRVRVCVYSFCCSLACVCACV